MHNKDLKLILLSTSVASVLFGLSMQALILLPGHAARACVVGSNLNLANISFNAFMAVALGYLLVKPFFISAKRFSIGSFLMTLLFGSSTFCGACLIPVLSIASFSSVIFFLSTYHYLVKMLLVVLVGLGIYRLKLIEKQGCKLK